MTRSASIAPANMRLCASRLVAPALRWIASQQLPTGELAAYKTVHGISQCWPCPFYSVLAMELLGCAAPQTSGFSRRLYEAIPAAERSYMTSSVLTVRWRLRSYIASQQESDGTWRLYGREGHSPVDPATTAFATAAFFDDRGARVEAVRAMAADLDRMPASNIVSEVAVCYLWTCAGIDGFTRMWRILERSQERGVARLAACWIFALCHEQIATPASDEIREALIAEVLKLLAEPGNCTSLGRTLALETVLILQHRGEEIEGMVAPLLFDCAAPWEWKPEPLAGDAWCPAFNLALLVNAVAKYLEGGVFSC
ncbi:MAG: hypothetical protein ACRD3N_15965 [Terracidiphilus sp.]